MIRFTERVESRERCAESGWYAFDYMFEAPLDREFIKGLRGFGGSFVFLEMLRKPFFKLESDHYIIKGVLGDDFFRMAVHGEYKEELTRLEEYLKDEYSKG